MPPDIVACCAISAAVVPCPAGVVSFTRWVSVDAVSANVVPPQAEPPPPHVFSYHLFVVFLKGELNDRLKARRRKVAGALKDRIKRRRPGAAGGGGGGVKGGSPNKGG